MAPIDDEDDSNYYAWWQRKKTKREKHIDKDNVWIHFYVPEPSTKLNKL